MKLFTEFEFESMQKQLMELQTRLNLGRLFPLEIECVEWLDDEE